MSATEVGKPAPDFTLPASDGTAFTLSKQRGKKVVLYFYPKDQTPACTQEACDFREFSGRFAERNAIVVGISPDNLRTHKRFVEKQELPFPLLSDPEHTVCELYGVWALKKMYGREYMGVVRSTFLIGEDGTLTREWRKVKVKNHAAEVLEVLESL